MRGCLSEQKENNVSKIANFSNYQKINKPNAESNPAKIYFPFSSPVAKKDFSSPNKVINTKEREDSNQKNSILMQNSNKKLQKNSSKSHFVNSFKNFSDEIFSTTANFINSNVNKMADRKQCSCDLGLGKLESCKNALKWFKKSNQTAKFNELKTVYNSLQKEMVEENVLDQIRKDVQRTYANNSFFNDENSKGSN